MKKEYLHTIYKMNLFNPCSRCFLPKSSKLAACLLSLMNAAYSLLSSPVFNTQCMGVCACMLC